MLINEIGKGKMIQHLLRFGMVVLCSGMLVSNALAFGDCGYDPIPNSHYDSSSGYYVCDSGFYCSGSMNTIVFTSRLGNLTRATLMGNGDPIAATDEYICVRCPPLEGMEGAVQAQLLASLHLAVDNAYGDGCAIPSSSPQTDGNGNTYVAVQGCDYSTDGCNMPVIFFGSTTGNQNDGQTLYSNCVSRFCNSQDYNCFDACSEFVGFMLARDMIMDDWTWLYNSGSTGAQAFFSWFHSGSNASPFIYPGTACVY